MRIWRFYIVICVCIHVFVYEYVYVHDGLTLAEQLLALCVTPKAMKSYFMTTYQRLWGVDGGGGCGCGLGSSIGSHCTVAVSSQDRDSNGLCKICMSSFIICRVL